MMATSSSKEIVNSLETEIKCSVCLEVKTLKVIPKCQHRLCQECIDRITEGGSQEFGQDYEYGSYFSRPSLRMKTLTCPECRSKVHVPSEGFPVCRLSETIRENLEKAKVEHEVPFKAESAKKLQPTCSGCERKINFYCDLCCQFLCSRCMIKTQCKLSEDCAHDGPDLDELLERKDNEYALWVDATEKQIFDSNNKKVEIERKYNSDMAEVRNDITRLEDDLELLSSGLEQLEDKTERIFFLDEQLKELMIRDGLDGVEEGYNDDDTFIKTGQELEVISTCTEVRYSRVVDNRQCSAICHTPDGQLIVGRTNGIHIYNKQMTEVTANLSSAWDAISTIAWKYDQIYYGLGRVGGPSGGDKVQVCDMKLKPLRTLQLASKFSTLSIVGTALYLTNPFISTSFGSSLSKVSLDGHPMGTPVCAQKLSNPSMIKPFTDSGMFVVAGASDLSLCTDDAVKWKVGLADCRALAVDDKAEQIWTVSNSGKDRVVKIFSSEGNCLQNSKMLVLIKDVR